MNNARSAGIAGEMSSGDALALRSAEDGWLSRDAIDEHTLAQRSLAESTAKAKALQRLHDSETLRLLPLVRGAAEDDLERLVQGVRDSMQRHFESRVEALTQTFASVIEALVDDPDSLVRLVTRLAREELGALPDHAFMLEIPMSCADPDWVQRLRNAMPWSRVVENPALESPRLRLEARSDHGPVRLFSLDPEAIKIAVGECLATPSHSRRNEGL